MVALQMYNVIFEDNHLLVVEKPFNMPMQEDSSQDLDLLTYYKQYIKDKYHKPNNVYLGLVHRLDRPTGGICVFAKTSKCASRLSEQIRTNKFSKQYIALVTNYNLKNEDIYIDHLQKNSKTNIVTVNQSGKYCELSYKVLSKNNELAKILVDLKTGRSHQIRVQFASRKQYLFGDQKYNPHSINKQQLALWSYSIKFNHPITKELLEFKLNPPNSFNI